MESCLDTVNHLQFTHLLTLEDDASPFIFVSFDIVFTQDVLTLTSSILLRSKTSLSNEISFFSVNMAFFRTPAKQKENKR